MQVDDYKDFEMDMLQGLVKSFPEAEETRVKKVVEEKFLKVVEEGKLLTLTDCEVNLIEDFRKWSNTPGSASGVFHWRKRYGKDE